MALGSDLLFRRRIFDGKVIPGMDLQELFQCIKGGKYRAFSVTNPGDLLVEPTLTLLNTNMCSSFIRENDHPNSDDHDWLHHFPQAACPGGGFGSCGFRKAARLGSQRLFCSSLCLFLFLCLLRITGFYEGQLAALEPGLFPKARQRDVFVRLQKWKKTNDAFRGMNTDIVYIQIQIYIYTLYVYKFM